MDNTKREFREEKRVRKRAGVKRRRRELKRVLAENPDEAPFVEPDFGRYATAPLNGVDRDATRHRFGPKPEEG